MSENPFIRYRERLDSYSKAVSGGLSDEWFVDAVSRLDDAVAAVDGHGFMVTPIVDGSALAEATGLEITLWIKDESRNVGGSHKARHLFGAALHLLVDEALGADRAPELAIASCGNAALGASVVARALDRKLAVFVPTWAEAPVLDRLDELGSTVVQCERRDGESGDPCYLRFKERVVDGAQPFSVQGTDTPVTFDGGRTIGWELADQVASLDRVYVQVGGGALATAVGLALPDVPVFPVQSEGCAPLERAWSLLDPDFDFGAAADNPSDFMWPWEQEPTSLATGILDDITYDWLPLLQATKVSGAHPIVAPEPQIVEAYRLAHEHTSVPVCATGTAGLAGLLSEPPGSGATVALLFTGFDR